MGGSPTPSVLSALAFYFVFLLGLDRLVQIVRAQNGTTPPSEGKTTRMAAEGKRTFF